MQLYSRKNRKWLALTTHIVVWLVIFSFPYMIRFNYGDHIRETGPGPTPVPEWSRFFYINTLTKLWWVALFYLNAFVLAPLFTERKKYLQYSLVVILIFGLITVTQTTLMGSLQESSPRFMVFQRRGEAGPPQQVGHFVARNRFFELSGMLTFNLAPFCLTIVASILYRLLLDKSREERDARQKQEENMRTELSFLRSQISPHFLFNILNNITALARIKSDELEPTVLKLSSLMRYMLYEANEDKVLLRTETEYLNSYIELQRQRFGQKVMIQVALLHHHDGQVKIEPMLLIPFVENAFKHGVGHIDEPRIDIALSIQQDTLLFTVSNKCSLNDAEMKDTASGIGFANVQRRLNLLYYKAHKLNIRKERDEHNNLWYHIVLEIKLPL